MKNIYIYLSLFVPLNCYATEIIIKNPCTEKKVEINSIISKNNKSIVSDEVFINDVISINKNKVILFSYLDNEKNICTNQPYDMLFLTDAPRYYPNLLKDVNSVFLNIYSENNYIVLSLEYGNAFTNIDKFYLEFLENHEVAVKKRKLYISREDKNIIKNYRKFNLRELNLNKVLNVY